MTQPNGRVHHLASALAGMINASDCNLGEAAMAFALLYARLSVERGVSDRDAIDLLRPAFQDQRDALDRDGPSFLPGSAPQ